MLSTDELWGSVVLADTERRLHCDTPLTDAPTEDPTTERVSDDDWQALRMILSILRSGFTVEDYDQVLLKLANLDDFIIRFRLSRIPGLLDGEIPSILLQLSMSENLNLREYALSCLSNLTVLVPGFLESYSDEEICVSIDFNIADTVSVTIGHLFRWMGNILLSRPDFMRVMLEKTPFEAIVKVATLSVFRQADKALAFFFYRVAQIEDIRVSEVSNCTTFFNCFLRSDREKAISFVLLGIHSILSNAKVPFESRIQMAETLQLGESIYCTLTKVQEVEMERKVCLLYALLGDLCVLRIVSCASLVPMLLELIHLSNQELNSMVKMDLCEMELFEALLKIVESSEMSLILDVWRWRNHLIVTDLVIKVHEGLHVARDFALSCLFFLLERVPFEELMAAVKDDLFDTLLEVISSQNKWIDQYVTCTDRILKCAQEMSRTDLVRTVLEKVEGVDRLNEVVEGMEESSKKPALAGICSVFRSILLDA